MATLTRRLQLLLGREAVRAGREEAEREHTSVAAVIRDAIERDVSPEFDDRVAAVRRFLSAEPMAVHDDPIDLEREIEEMFAERPRRWEP